MRFLDYTWEMCTNRNSKFWKQKQEILNQSPVGISS